MNEPSHTVDLRQIHRNIQVVIQEVCVLLRV